GLDSAFDSALDFGAGAICASAEASCRVAATGGFARGVGAAAATTGAGFALTTGAAASSSSSEDLPSEDLLLNSAANRPGFLPTVAASSPLPRFSISAIASS